MSSGPSRMKLKPRSAVSIWGWGGGALGRLGFGGWWKWWVVGVVGGGVVVVVGGGVTFMIS